MKEEKNETKSQVPEEKSNVAVALRNLRPHDFDRLHIAILAGEERMTTLRKELYLRKLGVHTRFNSRRHPISANSRNRPSRAIESQSHTQYARNGITPSDSDGIRAFERFPGAANSSALPPNPPFW